MKASLRWLTLCSLLGLAGGLRAETNEWVAGITEPYLDVTLSAQVPGVIATHLFEPGAYVRSNQVIVDLDKRYEELAKERRKYVMDNAKTEFEAMRAVMDATKGVSESKQALAQKEMEYNVAVVDYHLAEEQLRKRQIVAPLDGYVIEYLREVGESCIEHAHVVRVVETRRCYFVCNLDAKLGHALKVGQKVVLEVEAGSTTVKKEGEISFVSPVVDPASGLLKIKVLFENADSAIRPGVAGRMQMPAPAQS